MRLLSLWEGIEELQERYKGKGKNVPGKKTLI